MILTKIIARASRFLQNRHSFVEMSCHLTLTPSVKANNEDALEKLKNNPFYGKYSEKIHDFQRTSPEQFNSKLDEVKKKFKRASPGNAERPFSELGSPKPDFIQSYTRINEGLESIMKTELLKDKTADEISEIWREYHKTQEKISAIISAETYLKMYEYLKQYPIFLFPVPRSQGYEFVVSMYENHNCYFTTLLNYQAYKENSPSCLTINHYTDYLKEKGIVLMRGEYDKNALNASEAQCLANQLQLYYTAPVGDRKHYLLETFTYKPNSFKHAELIAEFENMALSF